MGRQAIFRDVQRMRDLPHVLQDGLFQVKQGSASRETPKRGDAQKVSLVHRLQHRDEYSNSTLRKLRLGHVE